MDLSPIKLEILEALLLHSEPIRAAQVAKELGKEFPSVSMHLIGLTRSGHAYSPIKGSYVISEKGKEALGLTEVTREKALGILTPTPLDKAFHFYAGIDKPLNLHAQDLLQFCSQIGKVNVDSVEFHFSRGDFQAWFAGLGDSELVKKTALLKKKGLKGEELRVALLDMAEKRCIALSKMLGQQVPPI